MYHAGDQLCGKRRGHDAVGAEPRENVESIMIRRLGVLAPAVAMSKLRKIIDEGSVYRHRPSEGKVIPCRAAYSGPTPIYQGL